MSVTQRRRRQPPTVGGETDFFSEGLDSLHFFSVSTNFVIALWMGSLFYFLRAPLIDHILKSTARMPRWILITMLTPLLVMSTWYLFASPGYIQEHGYHLWEGETTAHRASTFLSVFTLYRLFSPFEILQDYSWTVEFLSSGIQQ